MSDAEQREENDSENEEGSRIIFVNTPNIAKLFNERKLSLFVTTYQAGRVLLFTSPTGEKLSMLMRKLPRSTGIALGKKQLAVASSKEVWFFGAANNIRGKEGEHDLSKHDLVFLPRRSHVTGYIDSHQIFWHGGELFVVNTLYSCLCRLHEDWSFTPIWKPSFISKIIGEDRCHLNGVCTDQSGPRYATALGKSDTIEGWRESKADSGILIDMRAQEIICDTLSMPHSPYLINDQVVVLESGTGQVVSVDINSGAKKTLTKLNTFLRGIAFHEDLCFIGMCKAREKKSFGGLPLQDDPETDAQCGISVRHLPSFEEIGFIRFEGGVEELFDIVVLPGYSDPYLIGFETDEMKELKIFPRTNL